MISIDSLKRADIGRWVKYTGGYNSTEYGRIKSWNEKNIFVVYKCDNQWGRFKDFTGAATSPKDLIFSQQPHSITKI